MYFKKLEIIGFKSFANKTVIDFSKGITAVVGPNGCGKTNILDALRWVLGEQRTSMLRGSKMEEVIFSGTREVKPLGMAEVTLSIVNNRGILPTEYNEIQITRRLFRSGESEYLLNKVPCRLKDITELFYDTGVGAHSYSVIQQDMIEAVISDKAEERRFLFEEAAGITKYKQRKKAALRKMEATENDFLRLNDIYSEVQTQVRSLKRQQNKAERYQMISEEIKNWELYLNSNRIKSIEQEKRNIKAEYDQLHDILTEKNAKLNILTSELENSRKEQIDFEHGLAEVGNEIYEISEKAHGFEKEISILKEKKSNDQTLIERNGNEIEAFRMRSEILTEQKTEAQNNLTVEKVEIENISNELSEAENIQTESDLKLLEARSTKEESNQKMLDLEGRLSSGKTEDVNLREQEDELSQTITNLQSQHDDTFKSKAGMLEEQSVLRSLRDEASHKKQKADEQYKLHSDNLETHLEAIDDLAEEISTLKASVEACQARRNLLEDMMIHFEGYESGVKAAMEVKERWSGIYGTVADKFVPVEGMEIAVEAALGEMAKFILCENRSTAESIINYLKEENKGRIGILVPDTGTITAVVKRPELDLPEFVGWIDNFVTTDEKLLPLMQAVLARTAVFKAGSSPDNILERLPYGFKAVSTTGEVFSKNIISGGSDDKLPLFRRKENINEQEKLIEEHQRQLDEALKQKNITNAAIAETRADISSLSEKIESLSEELNSAEHKYNEVEYQIRGFDNEITRLSREIKNSTEKRESIRNRQYTLGLDFGQLTDLRKNLVTSMEESTKKLSGLETEASQSLEKVSSLQIQLVESKSRMEQTDSKIGHLSELEQEIIRTIDIKKNEIDKAKVDIITSSEKSVSLEEKLKEAFNLRQELNRRQSSLRTNQSGIFETVTEKEKLVKNIRAEKDEASEQTHQFDIKLTTIESESNSIVEKIKEDYDLDIHSVETSRPDDEIADEQASSNLTELKERLKKFGAVNLLALEEYKVAFEREQFLKEQLGDLSTAKGDLQATITKINHTARELFSDTFAKVKVNFKNLFTELFTGGEADIFLTDPSDPLESDIDIIARPRGKKLLSITMMSGGERALTAISLLFSLYLVKPSPFCILDEIDAPLDDANCRRFLRIIDKFSNQTQFITITHNKITMEASHNLYGVTMEQFGISKIVGVKFQENPHDDIDAKNLIVERDDSDDDFHSHINEDDSNGHGKSEPVTEITDSKDETIPHSVDYIPEKIKERINKPVITTVEEQVSDNDTEQE